MPPQDTGKNFYTFLSLRLHTAVDPLPACLPYCHTPSLLLREWGRTFPSMSLPLFLQSFRGFCISQGMGGYGHAYTLSSHLFKHVWGQVDTHSSLYLCLCLLASSSISIIFYL